MVVVVDPEWVSKNLDFNGLLENAESGALYKHRSCLLEAGSAVYVPMGYVPFLIPIAASIDWKSKKPNLKESKRGAEVKHLASYGISYFLEDRVRE
eukprot:9148718-Pyramimonas_sp.AAC.1